MLHEFRCAFSDVALWVTLLHLRSVGMTSAASTRLRSDGVFDVQI